MTDVEQPPSEPAASPPPPVSSRFGRSRISNGKLHGRRIDHRRPAARRFRDAVAALCAEVGQTLAAMPESRRAAVRMAATFIVATEADQLALAQGQALDPEQLVRQANTLQRLLTDLGLTGEGLERRRAAEAEAERKRLLDQHYPTRTWDR